MSTSTPSTWWQTSSVQGSGREALGRLLLRLKTWSLRLKPIKGPVFLLLTGFFLSLSGIFLFISGTTSFTTPVAAQTDVSITSPNPFDESQASHVGSSNTETNITIDVGGAVELPGLYQLRSNDRVGVAIEKAGGFTNDVDKDYVARDLNLAQGVQDGQKIYIPFSGERELEAWCQGAEVSSKETQNQSASASLISINTASLQELDELPGIGVVRGQAIIDGRPYSSLEELVNNDILTEKQFANIAELIIL